VVNEVNQIFFVICWRLYFRTSDHPPNVKIKICISFREEWEEAVGENGELLYIEPVETPQASDANNQEGNAVVPEVSSVLPAVSTKPFVDKQGKHTYTSDE